MTTDTHSRRSAVRLAGGTAAAGALAAGAVTVSAPADAARVSYKPGRFPRTKILAPSARHLLNRFSYGIDDALVAQVRSAGGHLAWFDRQLATAYDGTADGLCDWWPDLNRQATDLWSRNRMGTRGGWEVMQDYGARVLMRRLVSPRQVLEVMTEFWENHLHVPTTVDNVFPVRVPYGDVVRAHALGRFEDLLKAAALHPAMLMFLGAESSTKAHPNENLGRELLELHTLGIGNYGEDDVKAAARVLTGYRVDLYKTWAGYYSANDHWTGPVQVVDFADDNADADGRPLADRMLTYLAHHPATARRIATKLAHQFVADDASAGLVDRLAQVYLDSDTAIVPVLKALVRTPEFKSAVDRKVRDADEDVLATYRTLGVGVGKPKTDGSAANQIYWQVAMLGLEPLTWPRPDGQPVDNASWSSTTRALASMSFHWDMVNGWWPGDAVRFPRPKSWLPSNKPIRFRDLVDHLSRRLLQRASTETLLKSCCQAVGLRPDDRITAASYLVRSDMPRLVATVIDSPSFYQR